MNLKPKEWIIFIKSGKLKFPAYFDTHPGFNPKKIKHVSAVKGFDNEYLQNSNCLLHGYYKPVIRIHET